MSDCHPFGHRRGKLPAGSDGRFHARGIFLEHEATEPRPEARERFHTDAPIDVLQYQRRQNQIRRRSEPGSFEVVLDYRRRETPPGQAASEYLEESWVKVGEGEAKGAEDSGVEVVQHLTGSRPDD